MKSSSSSSTPRVAPTDSIDVLEMSIREMLEALERGRVTSVELVCAYLNRIAYYDRTGPCLHALAVLNENCVAEARASDRRRREGRAGALEGVPFTVKDSYKVAGLTVASGSPALADLVATDDAATVALLRGAGAVLLGKTNMPPMAAGGIQPGVYDYARSPYNPDYITAAYGSGSSNGSGTATAANLCAFGMAEETVSSGRSPASNNALVAYTPSRGVISIRGNWPLRPTCDVVVPHTRSVDDLLRLLDVLVVDDPDTTGDFWRQQSVVALPRGGEVFSQPIARVRPERLDGIRIGVPRMYIGEDDGARDAPVIRPSVRELWDRAADDLRRLGADVVPVDFPIVSHYEEDRASAQGLVARGLVPPSWRALEGGPLTAMALDEFLRVNADPALDSWADVDGDAVFPSEDAPIPVWITRARGGFDWQRLAELVKQGLPDSYDDLDGLEQLLRGLEEARRIDFEDWMTHNGLDLVAFPAAGDVGRSDLFSNSDSLTAASRNGVVYSNGNRAIRHLGIPTVTVPMGVMSDTQMPVGVTFAGAAYSDDGLLDCAAAYEHATRHRVPAYLTPSLPSGQIAAREPSGDDRAPLAKPSVQIVRVGGAWRVTVHDLGSDPDDRTRWQAWADGHILLPVPGSPGSYEGKVSVRRPRLFDEVMVVTRHARGDAHVDLVPLPDAT